MSMDDKPMSSKAVTQGWYTWLHHGVPVEYTNNMEERLAYIRAKKPAYEQAIRLAAIHQVPEERVPRAYADARRASDDAWWTYANARRAYDDAGRDSADARRAYAWRACDDAWWTYADAWRAYADAWRANHAALLALAREFAPDAPVRDGALDFSAAS